MQTDLELFAELEALGEDRVRSRLALKAYGENKRALVEEWLRRQDQSREERRESKRHIAQTVAAIAAIAAAVAATIGAIVSIIVLFSQ